MAWLDPPVGLLNSVQQLCWFHGKRTGKFDKIDQSEVSLATFNAADVIPMEICFLSQFLLRQPQREPQFANTFAKRNPRVFWMHSIIIEI